MSSSGKRVLNFCCLLLALGIAPMAALAQSDVALEKMQAKSNNRPLASLQEAAERANARAAKAGPPREVPNFRGEGKPHSGGGTAVADALLQDSAGEQIAMVGSGFYGASNNDNLAIAGSMIAPPDTDGQVGPDHYVQMINLLTTIFDKSGNIITGPFTSDAFWDGIGGN